MIEVVEGEPESSGGRVAEEHALEDSEEGVAEEQTKGEGAGSDAKSEVEQQVEEKEGEHVGAVGERTQSEARPVVGAQHVRRERRHSTANGDWRCWLTAGGGLCGRLGRVHCVRQKRCCHRDGHMWQEEASRDAPVGVCAKTPLAHLRAVLQHEYTNT